jgi:hypothetical protein
MAERLIDVADHCLQPLGHLTAARFSPENQLMAVAIRATQDRLEIGVPRALFAIRPPPPVRLDAYPYDVSPDGQRFVVNTLMDHTTSSTITVVLNWTAGLPNQPRALP